MFHAGVGAGLAGMQCLCAHVQGSVCLRLYLTVRYSAVISQAFLQLPLVEGIKAVSQRHVHGTPRVLAELRAESKGSEQQSTLGR